MLVLQISCPLTYIYVNWEIPRLTRQSASRFSRKPRGARDVFLHTAEPGGQWLQLYMHSTWRPVIPGFFAGRKIDAAPQRYFGSLRRRGLPSGFAAI